MILRRIEFTANQYQLKLNEDNIVAILIMICKGKNKHTQKTHVKSDDTQTLFELIHKSQ